MSITMHLALFELGTDQLRAMLAAREARLVGHYAIGIQQMPADGKPRRFRVCLIKWSGERWRYFRRMSGPKPEADILEHARLAAKRTGLPLLTDMELS